MLWWNAVPQIYGSPTAQTYIEIATHILWHHLTTNILRWRCTTNISECSRDAAALHIVQKSTRDAALYTKWPPTVQSLRLSGEMHPSAGRNQSGAVWRDAVLCTETK